MTRRDPRTASRSACVCAAALLLAVVPTGSQVHGQVIGGSVRSAEDGAPLVGAFVRLLDASGRQLAAVLSDARGAYELRAPEAGEYRVRVELIGREAVESRPLRLEPGQASTWSAALSFRPIEVRGIAVESSARCEVRPEEGSLVARIREEARKALEVASWAQREELFRYHLVKHRRELDPDGRRIIEENSQARAGWFRRPFASRPAAELVNDGFVQTREDGSFAYAPDADVLLSDAFIDTHCLRLERDGGRERIGLAFAPIRARVTPDIRGVLWLAAETAALESVEFRYTRFPEVPRNLGLGGEVEFERLPSGAWIVRRWSLEMPVRADVQRAGQPDVVDREIVGIMEEGGEVVRVLDGRGNVLLAAGRATLAGTVHDSIRGFPLEGAELRLVGTDHRTLTDEDGAFIIADLPSGRYSVKATHRRADSLDIVLPERPVDLEADRTSRVEIAIPTASPAAPQFDLVVEGELLDDATGRPLTGVLVSLIGPTGPAAGPALTDPRGTYLLRAPVAGPYRIRAETVGHRFGEIPTGTDGRPRFVEVSDTALVAATPGPRFLVSDAFARGYCLRLLPGPAGPGTRAIVFEPGTADSAGIRLQGSVRADVRRADVRGVLVLDAASLALRSFHYRYVDFPFEVPEAPPGGWMRFERLPDGAFFLAAWERRVPVIARVRPEEYRPGNYVRTVPAYVLHEGGWVRAAESAAGDTLWRRSAPPDAGVSRSMWEMGSGLERRSDGAGRVPQITNTRRRP